MVHVLQTTHNFVISRCCFAEDGKEIYNAREQLLFCSLNLLFSDVLVAVAFVVFFSSLSPTLPPPPPSLPSSPPLPQQTTTGTKTGAVYFSNTNRASLLSFRANGHHRDSRHPVDNYPRGYIEQLHHAETNSKAMFSPSFVDNMRIPRAMEVKIIESVNSLNNSRPHPPYSPPCHSPTRLSQDLLSADMFSFPKADRMPPSRQQSFRYSNMSTQESNERMYREKMLVSELREKLRNQHQVNE